MKNLGLFSSLVVLAGVLATIAFAQEKGTFARGSGADQQLWESAANGDLSGAQSAMGQGAHINFRGKRGGFTPLTIAAKNGHLDVVQFLVEHGASVNERDNARDKTPLLAAAYKQHFDVVKYLVEHGADVNIQAINGWTPLHDAAYIGNVEISKYLVDHGTNLSLHNEKNETPRQTAERGQHDAVRRGQTRATPGDYKEIIEYIKAHEK